MTQKQNAKVSKAAFVRARPTATVDEVIAAGKAENIEISRQAVHQVRHQARFEAKLNGKGKKKGAKKKSAVKAKAKHVKAPEAKKGAHFKTPDILGKYPNLRKLQASPDEELGAEALRGLVDGLRQMVKTTVKHELRSAMGGLFGPHLGAYLSD